MKKVILFFTMLAIFSACSQEIASSDEYKKFDNDEFSFEYPADWVEADMSNFNMAANIKASFVSEKTGNNIIVEVHENEFLSPSAEFTANLIVDQFELFGVAWGISEYEKLNYIERDYNGQKAGVLYAQYKIAQTGQLILTAQYIVPFGQKSYVLTYTIFEVVGSEEEMHESINRIFDSFQIKIK